MKSRIFFITYTTANIGLIAYGVMALIQPDILLKPFLEHVYQFPAGATIAITYLSGLFRLLGYFNIIPGLLGLLILYRYWVMRQGWYLKIVVASTILAYLGPVVFDNTVGRIGFFEILEHVFFVMVLISGLIMLKYADSITLQGASSASLGVTPPRKIESGLLTSKNPAIGLNKKF
jgi:hypothetical protein